MRTHTHTHTLIKILYNYILYALMRIFIYENKYFLIIP